MPFELSPGPHRSLTDLPQCLFDFKSNGFYRPSATHSVSPSAHIRQPPWRQDLCSAAPLKAALVSSNGILLQFTIMNIMNGPCAEWPPLIHTIFFFFVPNERLQHQQMMASANILIWYSMHRKPQFRAFNACASYCVHISLLWIMLKNITHWVHYLFVLWEIQHNYSQMPWKGCFLSLINTNPLSGQKKSFLPFFVFFCFWKLRVWRLNKSAGLSTNGNWLQDDMPPSWRCDSEGSAAAFSWKHRNTHHIFHSRMWTAYWCTKAG